MRPRSIVHALPLGRDQAVVGLPTVSSDQENQASATPRLGCAFAQAKRRLGCRERPGPHDVPDGLEWDWILTGALDLCSVLRHRGRVLLVCLTMAAVQALARSVTLDVGLKRLRGPSGSPAPPPRTADEAVLRGVEDRSWCAPDLPFP